MKNKTLHLLSLLQKETANILTHARFKANTTQEKSMARALLYQVYETDE
jgi:hypothetical protein